MFGFETECLAHTELVTDAEFGTRSMLSVTVKLSSDPTSSRSVL